MHTVTIGKSALRGSAIGLGCMGMSEFYGERDDAQSMRTLERAFELGVTHFDTSNVYGPLIGSSTSSTPLTWWLTFSQSSSVMPAA